MFKKKALVVKSNDFANGKLSHGYSVLMRDIFAISVAQITRKDTELGSVIIEISDVVNVGKGYNTRQVNNAAHRLLKETVEYKDGSDNFCISVFIEMSQPGGLGTIRLVFNPKLNSQLLKTESCTKPYTSYSLTTYLCLRGKYSKDLYEKLSVWLKANKQHAFDLDYLRERLNVPEYARNNFSQFRRKILEPAVKEINEKSSWVITYKTEKTRVYNENTYTSRAKISRIIFYRNDKDSDGAAHGDA
jgi:plasmid replication initiation protein